MVGQADIIRFLSSVGVKAACSACGKNDWSVSRGGDHSQEVDSSPHVHLLPYFDGVNLLNGQSYPATILVCMNCGHIQMHSLQVIQRWLKAREEEKRHKPESAAQDD